MGFRAAIGKIQQLETYDRSAMTTALLKIIREVRSSKLNVQVQVRLTLPTARLEHAFRKASSCQTFFG